jgi:chitin disaccharide deacetylase
MTVKPLIEKLGYEADKDKVVIFHIDDMGFSHSSNLAAFECLDFGVASCGSLIVPAPWFLEAAEIYRKNLKYDIGVHLTLTCEYDLYRWRALSSVDPSTGLLDSERSLWRTAEEAIAKVNVKAAEAEMRAQIQTALDAGVNVTHIDSHMGTVMHTKFIPTYLKLAKEFKVVPFLPRVSKEELIEMGMGDQFAIYEKMFDKIEESGVPLLDHAIIDTLGDAEDKVEYYCKKFSEIQPGVTHFLFHAAKMTPELQAITPDSAKWRNLDYEAFTDSRIKECVKENDLKIIGYKDILELM